MVNKTPSCILKSSCKVVGSVVSSLGVNNAMIWHKHFVHASVKVLQHVDSLQFFKNKIIAMDSYYVCPRAKITKNSFPISSSMANSLYDLVHVDVWGPYQSPTHDNKHFFLDVSA